MANSRFLPSADFSQIKIGLCPGCNQPNFALGPRGGMARNILCVHCFREYNVSLVGAELIAERCPAERVEDIYHIVSRPIAGHPQA